MSEGVTFRKRDGRGNAAARTTDAARSPAIAVRDLVKTFDEVEAVQGVNFEVATGEVFGFLGPNGAGKTTTINMLCTLPSRRRARPGSPATTS